MRVRVYAPAFGDHGAVDEKGFMDLPEGAVLADVYRRLKINPLVRPIVLCTLNYEFARKGAKLKDGDVVSFLSIVSGG
jgi:molybdopterin converting factor small subunit